MSFKFYGRGKFSLKSPEFKFENSFVWIISTTDQSTTPSTNLGPALGDTFHPWISGEVPHCTQPSRSEK